MYAIPNRMDKWRKKRPNQLLWTNKWYRWLEWRQQQIHLRNATTYKTSIIFAIWMAVNHSVFYSCGSIRRKKKRHFDACGLQSLYYAKKRLHSSIVLHFLSSCAHDKMVDWWLNRILQHLVLFYLKPQFFFQFFFLHLKWFLCACVLHPLPCNSVVLKYKISIKTKAHTPPISFALLLLLMWTKEVWRYDKTSWSTFFVSVQWFFFPPPSNSYVEVTTYYKSKPCSEHAAALEKKAHILFYAYWKARLRMGERKLKHGHKNSDSRGTRSYRINMKCEWSALDDNRLIFISLPIIFATIL